MIREFPPEHELLAFFEAEPTDLDADSFWPYKTLEFTTVRDGITVRCLFHPSYGQLTTRLLIGGTELAEFELRGIGAFRLVVAKGRETLVATFDDPLRLDPFALQLKPRVWAAWGNLHQFP